MKSTNKKIASTKTNKTNSTKTNKKEKQVMKKKTMKTTKQTTLSESETKQCQEVLRKQGQIVSENYEAVGKCNRSAAVHCYKIGKALTEIKATVKKMKQETFGDYCKSHFGFDAKYGYIMINNARVQDALEEYGVTVIKQGDHQLRILSKLKKEAVLKEVWEKITGGKKECYPTVSEVKRVMSEMKLSAKTRAPRAVKVKKVKATLKKYLKMDSISNDQEIVDLILQLAEKVKTAKQETTA